MIDAREDVLTAPATPTRRRTSQVAATPLESTANFLPMFAISSSLHETQYSRIFRS
jgi:urease accessory protein UreF